MLSFSPVLRCAVLRCAHYSRYVFYSFFLRVPDIDECNDGTDDCHDMAQCTNTDGNFTCECNQGYSGDGQDCRGKLKEIHNSLFV